MWGRGQSRHQKVEFQPLDIFNPVFLMWIEGGYCSPAGAGNVAGAVGGRTGLSSSVVTGHQLSFNPRRQFVMSSLLVD